MHEVVTLQLGSQANYAGTHYWNIQESYFTYGPEEESPVDHDVHFRQGIGSDGQDTYTPRSLIYDFKNSFGTLRQVNELYELLGDEATQQTVWPGAPSPQTQPALQQSEYQRRLNLGLDTPELRSSDIRFWSDYNRVYYHPRSLVQIHEAELDPGSRSFETWQSGEELFTALDKEHDLFERDLRPFLEECDQLQGIQLFSSADDGWAAFTNRYLERARDELDKLPIMVWMLSKNARSEQPRTINASIIAARSAWETTANSSIFVPVTTGIPQKRGHIDVETSSPWSTSAFQMTGIESLTLPTRLKPGQLGTGNSYRFGDVETLLNDDGRRKIAQLAFEVETGHSGRELNGAGPNGVAEHQRQERDMCDFFPTLANESDSTLPAEYSELQLSRGNYADEEDDNEGVDQQERRLRDGETRIERLRSRLRYPILDSFPALLYGNSSSSGGDIPSSGREQSGASVRATLRTSGRVGAWLRVVERSARRYMPIDEREEMANGLQSAAEAYDAPSFDDSDWDD